MLYYKHKASCDLWSKLMHFMPLSQWKYQISRFYIRFILKPGRLCINCQIAILVVYNNELCRAWVNLWTVPPVFPLQQRCSMCGKNLCQAKRKPPSTERFILLEANISKLSCHVLEPSSHCIIAQFVRSNSVHKNDLAPHAYADPWYLLPRCMVQNLQ